MTLGNMAVMGYFNINLDPDSTDSSTVTLRIKDKDMYPLAGPVQVVEKCTRHCQGQRSSLIDQVWLNKVLKHVVTKTITTDSNHDLIVRTLKTAGEATW